MAEKLQADTKTSTGPVKSESVDVEKRDPTRWERSFVRDVSGKLIGQMVRRRMIHL